MEFSKDDKRIVLSHTATYREEEEKNVVKKKASTKKSTGSSASTSSSSDADKATLGDLDALASLKEQMLSGGSDKEAKKATKKSDATPKVSKDSELASDMNPDKAKIKAENAEDEAEEKSDADNQ